MNSIRETSSSDRQRENRRARLLTAEIEMAQLEHERERPLRLLVAIVDVVSVDEPNSGVRSVTLN
jgi:hypothetical protein